MKLNMKNNNQKTIPIFIGYDYRERAATNVLIDSLYQNTSYPLSITTLVKKQLAALISRCTISQSSCKYDTAITI